MKNIKNLSKNKRKNTFQFFARRKFHFDGLSKINLLLCGVFLSRIQISFKVFLSTCLLLEVFFNIVANPTQLFFSLKNFDVFIQEKEEDVFEEESIPKASLFSE